MYNDDGKPEDIVPEHVALRRGMVYRKDRHGKVCQAEIEAPLLRSAIWNSCRAVLKNLALSKFKSKRPTKRFLIFSGV